MVRCRCDCEWRWCCEQVQGRWLKMMEACRLQVRGSNCWRLFYGSNGRLFWLLLPLVLLLQREMEERNGGPARARKKGAAVLT